MRLWQLAFLIAIGALAGAAAGVNWLASGAGPVTTGQLLAAVGAGSAALTTILLLTRWATRWLLDQVPLAPATRRRFETYDAASSAIWLVMFAGAFGVRFIGPVIACVVMAWLAIKGLLLYAAATTDERRAAFASLGWLGFLFLISGFAALIYQIVWQRALFAAFGVNIESITVIVSLFMLGLGVGSFFGGWLSSRFPRQAPILFLAAELGIGAFGLASLPLIQRVSDLMVHGSLAAVSLSIYALLCLPTALMGATLPILVGHLHRHYRNVGKSVGMLYCINTLGSAIACFVTAEVLFVFFGQQAAVIVAAACNVTVGVLVSVYARRIAQSVSGAATIAQT